MPEPDRPYGIPRRSPANLPPLSAAQQRFWFFEQFAPGTRLYNRPFALRMRGPLDADALEQALNDIVARHDVLRTTYTVAAGRLIQRIAEDHVLELERIDLRDVDPETRQVEVARLALDGVLRPIDLAAGPVIRAQLLRIEDNDHALVLTVHHIAFDGWSAGVLSRELADACIARRAGREPDLPALPIQYADYAAWQSTRLEENGLRKQLDFWRTQMDGVRGVLELPVDRARPRQRNFHGARCSVLLPPELADRLQQMSRQNGATLFMTLLAAWTVLLNRLSGDEDIVVGCPIAGRTRVELEGLIGCFINMVPIRTGIKGDPTFTELMRRVRTAALGAFANQDTPLQTLLAEVRPERDPARSPLFQVMFNLRNLPPVRVEIPGLEVTEFEISTGGSLVDLSLEVAPGPDGLHASLEYDSDLFEDRTAERMLGYLRTLLDAIAADPSRRLSELPILSETERKHVLSLGSGGTHRFPDGWVHERVSMQAGRTPDATAVAAEPNNFTYRELDQQANRLAHRLQELGVGADMLVGLYLDRSVDLMVALLATLKAGGAFVPLDPALPADRLAFMLEDSAPRVVLTLSALLDRVPDRSGTSVLCLDAEHSAIDSDPDHAPDTRVRPTDAAYVIYTSGSTGQPKGAVVTQEGFRNLVLALAKEYELEPGDRIVQFASISFDGMIEEVFCPWVAGATVVLRTDEWLASVAAIQRAINRERISVLNLPTAFWHEWTRGLATVSEALPETLRLVIAGGEKAAADAFRTWQAATGGQVRWVNTYGPAETAVVATVWDGSTADAAAITDVPIGRPIVNTHVYVLDRTGRPVPVGIPGELCIGGAGVGRGYLKRPDLTAERFVDNPFAVEPGARMYRTGDRVRFNAAGDLEFLGRLDRQVKLRGYRIEPGEIEVALRNHHDVADAVVVLRDPESRHPKLTAYVVASGAAPLDTAGLRRFLSERLPVWMMPAAFVPLPALPVGPTGKLDRRALPEPDSDRAGSESGHVAPRNEIERRMTLIWEDLLGVSGLGVTDDFFEYGGHSLLALRLGTRIELEFGAMLPMSALFEQATVEHLASRVGRIPSPASPLVPVQPRGSRRPFFCVHEFFGDVFLYDRLARRLGEDQPFFGLQASGVDGTAEPIRDIGAMAASYVDAVRTVQPQGPYALGGLCAGGLVALEMARQLTERGEEIAVLALLDSAAWTFRPAHERPEREHAVRDFVEDLPNWLGGLRDLTAAQWRDVLRLKAGLWRERFKISVRHDDESQNDPSDRRARAIGRAFRLSRHQRRVAHAFRQALQAYVPLPFPGRIVLLRARMQPLFGSHDPSKGWNALAPDGLEIRPVPGNHLGMLQEPHVRVLARELAEVLASPQSRA